MKKKALGKGLSALLSDQSPDLKTQDIDNSFESFLPIEKIRPSQDQPRHIFAEDALLELSESIREKGILQPILVKPVEGEDRYQIIAGERRWRAAKKVGLKEIPIIIKDITEEERLELALIENVQRQDLSVIEEAKAYKSLIERFSYNQQDLSKKIGKSRSHIANLMRLLSLPEDIQQCVQEKKITMGHARALLSSNNPQLHADLIVEKGLSVRDIEALIQEEKLNTKATEEKTGSTLSSRTHLSEDKAELKLLEENLRQSTGLSVSLKSSGQAGQMIIKYKSLDELDVLCSRLSL